MRPTTNHRSRAKLEIGVLYGFRALMVLFVLNYHLWQQSWIPQYGTLWGQYINLDYWTRSSYLFVDGMILLSGFLLFLPHAGERLEGIPAPSVRRFWFNRIVRIVPSYLLAVLAAFVCIALPQKLYPSTGVMMHDLLSHLTFTFLFWPQTYIATPLNVALWTIAVEMQFYLIFPLLASAMKKRPLLTAAGMMFTAWGYRLCVKHFAADTSILINQLPAFLDVYALGMLGAGAYRRFRLHMRRAGRVETLAVYTLTAGLFLIGLWTLSKILHIQSSASLNGYEALRLSQMAVRLPLAITLLVMMLSAAFWPPILQKLLDNRLMRFLSAISMNLYIWHQVLAVEMRKAWFPDVNLLHTDPNQQKAYMLLCISVAVLFAMAVTFGVEQPLSRLANRLFKKRT